MASLQEVGCQRFSLFLSTLERSDSRLVQRLGDPFLHPIHSVGGMIPSHKAHLLLHFLFFHVSSSKRASTETCFHFLLPLATFSVWGSVGHLSALSSGSIEISDQFLKTLGEWMASFSRLQPSSRFFKLFHATGPERWQGGLVGRIILASQSSQNHNR